MGLLGFIHLLCKGTSILLYLHICYIVIDEHNKLQWKDANSRFMQCTLFLIDHDKAR